jgi:hypothetical protein
VINLHKNELNLGGMQGGFEEEEEQLDIGKSENG